MNTTCTIAAENGLGTLLAYFGHHKCGTTWIQHIINYVCELAQLKVVHHHNSLGFGGDIAACHGDQPFDFWCFSNADVAFVHSVKLKGFHVVRDPRDVVVSGYFSHLNSHPDHKWTQLRNYRPHLRSLSKHDGLLAEMKFDVLVMSQMMTWDYANPDILEVRFEELIAADTECFAKIFAFLGLFPGKLTLPQISAATEKYSFVNLSKGRPPGQEDCRSHYRKGQAGDWRNHFEAAHVEHFKKLYNPLLLKLGYETDEDWSNPAPPQPVSISSASAHEEGLRLFQAGKFEEASQLLHQALLEAESAERWNDWATAEWFCGRAGQAEIGYRQALSFDPNHAEAALNLTVVLSKDR